MNELLLQKIHVAVGPELGAKETVVLRLKSYSYLQQREIKGKKGLLGSE